MKSKCTDQNHVYREKLYLSKAMKEVIQFRYFNERLQIGMVDIKQVYLLVPELTSLNLEVYRGKLVYRAKGSAKRISYDQVKKGLRKTNKTVERDVPKWLFDYPLSRPLKK